MKIDTQRLRTAIEGRNRDRTHSEDCAYWSDHRDCALLALIDEVERHRSALDRITIGLSADASAEIAVQALYPSGLGRQAETDAGPTASEGRAS